MIRAASKKEQIQGSYHYGYRLIKRMDRSIDRAVGNQRPTNKVPPHQGRGDEAQKPTVLHRPLDPYHRVGPHSEHHRRRDQRFSSRWEYDCHITATRRFSLCNL